MFTKYKIKDSPENKCRYAVCSKKLFSPWVVMLNFTNLKHATMYLEELKEDK